MIEKMKKIPKLQKSIIRWFNPNYRTQEEWFEAHKALSEKANSLYEDLTLAKNEYATLLMHFDEYKVQSIVDREDLQNELKIRSDNLRSVLDSSRKICSKYEKTIDNLLEKIGEDNTKRKILTLERDKAYQDLVKLQQKYGKEISRRNVRPEKPFINEYIEDMRGL